MNNMIIMADSVVGTRNIERARGNQDIIGTYQDGEIVCASVNDGCSGCRFPQLAGKLNAKVAESAAKRMCQIPVDEKRFKHSIASEYKKEMKLSGVSSDELCSTTAFVVIEKSSASFIAFSCGDSGILSFDSNLNVSLFLEPGNGFRKTLTYFTNDPYAVLYAGKFRKGELGSGIAGFILYTDGAEKIAEDLSGSDNSAHKLLRALYSDMYNVEKDRLFSELTAHTSDDISIVVVAPKNDPRLSLPLY